MQIPVTLPNDFLALQSPADIERDMRLSYSLWLFRNARVTLGRAAEQANLRRQIADRRQARPESREDQRHYLAGEMPRL